MTILEGILKDSKGYYNKLEKEILSRLSKLPKGSIKRRKISDKIYFYLQYRHGNKIIHKYLGKDFPEKLEKLLKNRIALKKELSKVKKALKMLRKTK